MEIEKKFLVNRVPKEALLSGTLQQGYLAIDNENEREVRIRNKSDEKYTQTVKSFGDMIRHEVEFEISGDLFNELWDLTVEARVEKSRYVISVGEKLTAEVDVYEGNLDGLVTVEVEFPSEEVADNFEAPDWFGEDITFDSRYKNRNLAVNGLVDDFDVSFLKT